MGRCRAPGLEEAVQAFGEVGPVDRAQRGDLLGSARGHGLVLVGAVLAVVAHWSSLGARHWLHQVVAAAGRAERRADPDGCRATGGIVKHGVQRGAQPPALAGRTGP